MTYAIAALLGILQGLTEFLPVSSTAHLLIAARVLGYDDPGGVFTVMIQLGSILAVMWLYRAKIVAAITGLPADAQARRFALMLFVAFLPAVPIGAFGADYVQSVLYSSTGVIATAFVIGGLVMLVVEAFRPAPDVVNAEDTPMPRALGVGMCQALALIPGVSRSGATIVGGMLMRLDRPAAAEFSFFLAMPTMVAAFVYELVQVKDYLAAERAAEIALGFITSFLAALVVVRPFLGVVRRSGFVPFAWYRIALGLALYGGMWAGWSL